jgi:uncharacterized protein (TIGR02001 family)
MDDQGITLLEPLKWCALLLLLASVCHADGLGGDVGIASDEVLRGLTQSDHQASPEADLHYNLSGWYAGASAMEVRRGAYDSPGVGLVAYLGYQYRFSDDWSAGLTARHYDYPGYRYRNNYDYEEGVLSVSWRDLITASVVASPDTFVADRHGHYGSGAAYSYEIGSRLPLAYGFCANAGLGFYDINRQIGTGYAYGSAGISKQWHSVNFDLRYIGTDDTAKRRFGSYAENRLLFSVLYLF